MAKRTPLTADEFEVIRSHNERLIDGCNDGISQLRMSSHVPRPAYIQGQIDYWLHAVKALRWSTAIAAQRAGMETYGRTDSQP